MVNYHVYYSNDGHQATQPEFPLLNLRSLQYELSIQDPSTLSGTLIGPRSEVYNAAFQRGAQDIWLYREDEFINRYRISDHALELSSDSYTVNVEASDYRKLLNDYKTKDGTTYNGVALTGTVSTIVTNLINAAQGLTNGNLGITISGTHWTGTASSAITEFTAGEGLWDCIQAIVGSSAELRLTPQLVLEMYEPYLSTNSDVTLDNGMVQIYTETGGAPYYNVVTQFGADTTTAYTASVSDLATRPEGRKEGFFTDTTLTLNSDVILWANRNLAESSLDLAAFDLTLKAGRWEGLAHIQPGDEVGIVNDEVNVNLTTRVLSMSVSRDDDGRETVVVHAGRPKVDFTKILASVRNRADYRDTIKRQQKAALFLVQKDQHDLTALLRTENQRRAHHNAWYAKLAAKSKPQALALETQRRKDFDARIAAIYADLSANLKIYRTR